jgi:hypothetical protein
MNTVKTLILFVVLAILAAYVYFYEIKGGEEREEEKAFSEKIIPFEKDSGKTIEIRSIFNQFRFERQGTEWAIKNPVDTEGDKSTIDGLLNTLNNMKLTRQFTIKKGEEVNYGLVGRSYLVILEYTSGNRDSVWFGDETPISGNVFAARGDTIVFTVASHTKNNITKNLFDWRDKSVAKVSESEVRELKLKNSYGSFQLTKEGADWQIIKPRKVQADNSAINSLLRKFESGKAKSVVSESFDDPTQFNLKKPAYQIDLYVGEGKAHKRIILSKLEDNKSNVKDDSRPHVMTVDSLFIRDIDKSFFQLRYKKISEFDKDAIDSLVVDQGDSTLYFVKDTTNTWKLAGENAVKEWKMNSFLNSLNNLEAKNYIQENISNTTKYGFNMPHRKIACYKQGEKVQTVLLNSHNGKKLVLSQSKGVIVEIEDSAYNSLEVKEADFVDTAVQSIGVDS